MIAMHSAIQYKSNVYALLALMQLNASRFKARQDANGNIITLENQDRSLWNYQLMGKGFSNLDKSTLEKQSANYLSELTGRIVQGCFSSQWPYNLLQNNGRQI